MALGMGLAFTVGGSDRARIPAALKPYSYMTPVGAAHIYP